MYNSAQSAGKWETVTMTHWNLQYATYMMKCYTEEDLTES